MQVSVQPRALRRCCANIEAIPVLMDWFRGGVAVPVGIAATGSSIGGVIYPVLIQHLLPTDGFENTLIVAISLLIGLFIFVNLTVRLPKNSILRQNRRPLMTAHLLQPMQEPHFVVFTLASATFGGGFAIVVTFIVTIASEYGLSNPWRTLVILNGCR